MKSSKFALKGTLIAILAVLISLGAYTFSTHVLVRSQSPFYDGDLQTLQSIEIFSPGIAQNHDGAPLLLKKKDGLWYTEQGALANYTQIAMIFDFLSTSKVLDRHINTAKRRQSFGLSDPKEWVDDPITARYSQRVRLTYQDGKTETLLLGNYSSLYENSQYVLSSLRSGIYTVTPSLVGLPTEPESWIEHYIAPQFRPEEFTAFHFIETQVSGKNQNTPRDAWIYRVEDHFAYTQDEFNPLKSIRYSVTTPYLFGEMQAWHVEPKAESLDHTHPLLALEADHQSGIRLLVRAYELPKKEASRPESIDVYLEISASTLSQDARLLHEASLLNSQWKGRAYFINRVQYNTLLGNISTLALNHKLQD